MASSPVRTPSCFSCASIERRSASSFSCAVSATFKAILGGGVGGVASGAAASARIDRADEPVAALSAKACTLIARLRRWALAVVTSGTVPASSTRTPPACAPAACASCRLRVAGASSRPVGPSMRTRAHSPESGASGVTVTTVAVASAPAGMLRLPATPLAVKATLPPAGPMVAVTGSPTAGATGGSGGGVPASPPPPQQAARPMALASATASASLKVHEFSRFEHAVISTFVFF